MINKSLLIPYITAGFPDKKLFAPILKMLLNSGVDYIEVGVPHSDPLADGPVIQHASKIALENGVTLKWIVETLRAASLHGKIKPLILFSYLNPVLQYGLEKLLRDLPRKLFCGLIIPDLPLEEAKNYISILKKHNLRLIPLIAPTTKKNRMKKIVRAYCNMPLQGGFIYLVSVTGTTGIRRNLPSELKQKIKEIKSITDKPVVVGFGISNKAQAKKVISFGADGVVVGSALIKNLEAITNNKNLSGLKKFISSFKK